MAQSEDLPAGGVCVCVCGDGGGGVTDGWSDSLTAGVGVGGWVVDLMRIVRTVCPSSLVLAVLLAFYLS